MLLLLVLVYLPRLRFFSQGFNSFLSLVKSQVEKLCAYVTFGWIVAFVVHTPCTCKGLVDSMYSGQHIAWSVLNGGERLFFGRLL